MTITRALSNMLSLYGVLFAALAAFFWWTFHERYYKYKDCIYQLTNSSCRTPNGGNVTAGGALWSVFAVCFTFLALVCLGIVLYRWFRPPQRA